MTYPLGLYHLTILSQLVELYVSLGINVLSCVGKQKGAADTLGSFSSMLRQMSIITKYFKIKIYCPLFPLVIKYYTLRDIETLQHQNFLFYSLKKIYGGRWKKATAAWYNNGLLRSRRNTARDIVFTEILIILHNL